MSTQTKTAETIEQVRTLSWIDYVAEVNGPFTRDDATHRIESPLSELRLDVEIHTLQNLGVTISAFSATPDKGSRLYVRI